VSSDNLTIAYMDFKSFSLGDALYNVMFVAALDGRPLIGTFNCPFDYWEQWQPVIFAMIQTIREIK